MNKEALTTPALEALLQAPSLAILAVDKQGCVILWSPSASRMFGWTESEVLGRFLPIVPEEHRQGVYDRIQSGLKGELISALDVRRLRKDGSLVDVSLWTTPLRDSNGEVIGILGLYADITARKRAEGALQQTEAELRRVLAAVSDYIYSGEFDSDGRFFYHYYSPAVERIMGRPPLFFLAGPERWLSAVHPEDRPRLAQAFARLQTGQSASEEEEYRIVLPDGAIRWVRDSVIMSQGTDGRRFVNGVVSDITARKQTEEALRESELELRRVLGAASDYLWSGDFGPEGRFRYRYYSPAVERITGRPAEFYMAGSERWMSTVHPEDRPRLAEISERLLSGQSVSCENEHRIVLPDGTIRWVRANVTVSQSAGGHRRLDGVVSDITARKQSEEALRESEERYRTLAESAADAIFIIDRDDRVQYLNTYAASMLGSTPKELIGKRRADLFPPDTSEHQRREIEAVFESGRPRRIQNRTPFAGGELWLDTQLVPLRSVGGEVRAVMGISRDVTDQKRAEEAVRESEDRYRLLAEAIPQPVWRSNAQGERLDSNGRWYEYTGQTPEEARGNGWMKALHRDDVGRVMQEASDGVAGGELYRAEYRLRRAADGSYRWHLARALPMKDKDGRIMCWFGSAVDIDDQKRARDELETRIEERTMELVGANAAMRKEIAERKHAEEALRASERQSRAILDHTFQLMGLMTPAGILTAANRTALAFSGIKESDVIGKPFWETPWWTHSAEMQDKLRAAVEAASEGQFMRFEASHPAVDGSLHYIDFSIKPVKDESGNVAFLIPEGRDITEQRRAEEGLRLRGAALEAAANGIVITDLEGHILWVNPAFTKLTGYELSEVIGKNPSVLKSGQHDKAFYQDLWQTVLSGQVWHGEMVNKRKGGSLYTEEMTITPVRSAAGEITHFIAIKQDITEWKLAEESRRHLAAIVESSDDAIVSADLDGTITSWNAAAQRLYNYTAEEILGRTVSVLVPRNRRGEIREILKKLRCGEHIQHYETVRLKKGGIPVEVSITVSPTKNDAGQVIGVSAITHDITERKELEQAVVEASSREQRRIGQDLHDGLCQQLTGIGFLWKAIAQREAAQALPEAAEVAEISQLITKTIGEARDLAWGLCPVELESNDLGVALKNLGLSMERLFTISCVVRCQQPVLLADKTVATHLYRVAQEAISNAIGHGKAARVWIHLVWKKNQLTLRIRDNGSGFSKRRGFKEGIGMRSMKYRAQVIGGSLTIESKRGAGTTVACVSIQPRSRSAGQVRRHTPG